MSFLGAEEPPGARNCCLKERVSVGPHPQVPRSQPEGSGADRDALGTPWGQEGVVEPACACSQGWGRGPWESNQPTLGLGYWGSWREAPLAGSVRGDRVLISGCPSSVFSSSGHWV